MKEYHFPQFKSDEEKQEFYDEWKRIQNNCKSIGSDWNGDYLVATYEDENGRKIELWDNVDLGICHSIKYLDECKLTEVAKDASKVHFPLSENDRITYYDKTIKLGQSMHFEIYKIGNKYYDVYGTEVDENGNDLTECKKITESIEKTSVPVINIIINEFERLYDETGVDKESLVDNGEIYYMNGNMGTDGDWQDNKHLSYFMSFYKSTGLGFAKISVDCNGKMYGCYYLDEGKGEPQRIEKASVSNSDEMIEVAALLFEQTDELGIYSESLNKINLDAEVQSLEYDWLFGINDEDFDEDNYEDDLDEEDDWDEEDEYYESFHKKIQEDKNDNMKLDDSIFDDRDREIFNQLKNQKEDKTVFDLLQDRIGVPMSVGDFNTALKNIFSKHDEVFLLESMLYNVDTDEPQDVVVWDEDDMYTITIKVKDLEESMIEITDVNVE